MPKIVLHSFELHLGEAQAIVLAREISKDALLLMDDSSGRAFAETWGLKVKGTLYVIMTSMRRELLDKAEARETVLTLVRKGFRINQSFWRGLYKKSKKATKQQTIGL